MRKFIFLFALMLVAKTATAYGDNDSGPGSDEFVCELNSGATVTWQLTEEPNVELNNRQFVISSTRATVYYVAEDVKRFRLHKSPTGIETIPQNGAAKDSGTVTWTGSGQLLINGLKAGENIAIYATDGRQVLRYSANPEGMLTIFTNTLLTGIYIVKSQSINLKFAKK